MHVDPNGLYYIKKNEDGTYTAVKASTSDKIYKGITSILPLESIMMQIEKNKGYVGGTSMTSYLDVASGIVSEIAEKIAKRFVPIIGEIVMVAEGLGAMSQIRGIEKTDDVIFSLLEFAGYSSTSDSQKSLEMLLMGAEKFINTNSDYFLNVYEFSHKTRFQMDMALLNAARKDGVSGYEKQIKKYTDSLGYYLWNNWLGSFSGKAKESLRQEFYRTPDRLYIVQETFNYYINSLYE